MTFSFLKNFSEREKISAYYYYRVEKKIIQSFFKKINVDKILEKDFYKKNIS